jgi:hypothetical protein
VAGARRRGFRRRAAAEGLLEPPQHPLAPARVVDGRHLPLAWTRAAESLCCATLSVPITPESDSLVERELQQRVILRRVILVKRDCGEAE